jgi:nitroreductase
MDLSMENGGEIKMSFMELAEKRQSVRKYSNLPVEEEKIEMCIKAARLAPSACNSQPWKIIVVNDPDLKEKVAKETYNMLIPFNKFVHSAPVILVMVIERPNLLSTVGAGIKGIDFTLVDLGIAAEHVCLQAAELGLGTCILGWFNEGPIKKLLNIPKDRKIGLLVCLGYPEDDKIREKVRKPIEKLVGYNRYE